MHISCLFHDMAKLFCVFVFILRCSLIGCAKPADLPKDIPGCFKWDLFNSNDYVDVATAQNFDQSKVPTCFCDIRNGFLDVQCMFGTKLTNLDTTLSQIVSAGHSAIRTLTLEGPNLGKDVLTRDTFKGLSIEILVINPCDFTLKLATDALLDSVDTLKSIALKECHMDPPVIPEAFMPLKNLQNLTLQDCFIEMMGRNVFGQLTNLSLLRLAGTNKLREILPGTFDPLENLKYLDLSGNGDLNDTIWPEINKLHSLLGLDLGSAQVQHLTADSISNVTMLQDLFLADTSIVELPTDAFKHQPHLQYVNLRHSSLSNIKANAFRGAKELQYLLLDGTYLANIEVGAFNDVANLSLLGLAYTDIKTLRRGVFDPLTSLRILDLSLIETLTNIEDGALNLPRLEELMLNNAGENFTTIRRGTFAMLGELRVLDLSNTQIDHIDANSFDNLRHLSVLYLNATKLTTLPEGVFDGISDTITEIDLSNNYWDCNASMAWFPLWIEDLSNRSRLLHINNWEDFQCYHPYELNGQLFRNLPVEAFLANYSNSIVEETTIFANFTEEPDNVTFPLYDDTSPWTTARRITFPSTLSTTERVGRALQSSNKPNLAKIIIPVVIGCILLFAIVAIVLICLRRKRNHKVVSEKKNNTELKGMEHGSHSVPEVHPVQGELAIVDENHPKRKTAVHKDEEITDNSNSTPAASDPEFRKSLKREKSQHANADMLVY